MKRITRARFLTDAEATSAIIARIQEEDEWRRWYDALVLSTNGIHRVFYGSSQPVIGDECDGVAAPNRVIGYTINPLGTL